MSICSHILLQNRGLLGVSGDDATDFLQGLVSNDVTRVSPDRALYSALLSPQGKFLHDFFIFQIDGGLLIDCEADRLDDLKRKLTMYKLRSKVDLIDRSEDFCVAALIGDDVADALELDVREGLAKDFLGGVVFIDPRLAAIGGRAVIPQSEAQASLDKAGFPAGSLDEYETARLHLGLPDGSRDMIVDKAILLENGFNELNGVDWDKGCYMGQELTARTHYRGLVKKRLMPVHVDGPLPSPGTPLMLGDKQAGEMRSGLGDQGLAMVRLEQFESIMESGEALSAEGTHLHPTKPNWAEFKSNP
ncbi:MAG: folate-binding protein YgfZ [Rhodospirillaceae bacterium]|jgi:folate-binding protein YgfZ|nr:folate-binding protein YgfZ [Rhodospirillaceae bacterium]MBT5244858.1 folate-binding protein YgfZ [Rhodospirillaceae bacterium]MBT5562232.1 folate-binding protein YgfZ [Rhodospirillaceae bacterium]MBT6242405.1 folate-binding protein YgfZ [Rhodospirillaceae bacterium]MBT7138900.1 folate-binding protein YgfZ [Rhodospirillaceae bacterium]